MNLIKTLSVVILSVFAFSCQQGGREPLPPAVPPSNHRATAEMNKNIFQNIKFESKYDLSCGMPLTAGLSDSAHYKGKVYGFCSLECKEAFLKDPKTYLSAAKNK